MSNYGQNARTNNIFKLKTYIHLPFYFIINGKRGNH